MTHSIPATLIADIGGTHARFALAHSSTPWFSHTQTLQCGHYASIYDAINRYLTDQNIQTIGAICFAVAGSILDGSMSFLNNNWFTNEKELQKRYNVSTARLLNDFEAIAYALPTLAKQDLMVVQSPRHTTQNFAHKESGTFAILGPGSGLGVAGVKMTRNNRVSLASEGGHVGFAPNTRLQTDVLKYLQTKFDRVSNERLLSGPGLVNIYEALCQHEGLMCEPLNAAEIARKANSGNDKICARTLGVFFEVLGQVAGDVALTFGAYNGVYIAGGICQRHPQQLQDSKFRSGFENKGRYREIMQTIPTYLIRHENPGLLGASVYANRLVNGSASI